MRSTKTVTSKKTKSSHARTTESEIVSVSNLQTVPASKPRVTRSLPQQLVGKGSQPLSLTGSQTQMLLGTMLGDGSMSAKNKNPLYRSQHSYKQHEYNLAKYQVLSEFVRTPPKKAKNYGYGDWSSLWATLTAPALWPIADLCLHEDKKLVTQRWLDQLTWEGVAWWYQDDGSLSKGHSITFHTQGFSKLEVELLASWLTQNGIPAKVLPVKSRHKSDRTYWVISLSVAATYVLAEKIQPFIVPSMQYKIGLPERQALIMCAICGEEFLPSSNHSAKYNSAAKAVCPARSCKLKNHRTNCEKSLTPERRIIRNQKHRDAYIAGGNELKAKCAEHTRQYRLRHPEAAAASKKKCRDKQREQQQQSVWTCQRCQLQEPKGTKDAKTKYCPACRVIVTKEIKDRNRYPLGHPKLSRSHGPVNTESLTSQLRSTGPSLPVV